MFMTQTCGDLCWGGRCGEKVKTQACGDLRWEADMTHALLEPLTRHCMLTLARLASLPCPLHPCRPRLPPASFAARPLPRLSTNPVSPATVPPPRPAWPLLLATPAKRVSIAAWLRQLSGAIMSGQGKRMQRMRGRFVAACTCACTAIACP